MVNISLLYYFIKVAIHVDLLIHNWVFTFLYLKRLVCKTLPTIIVMHFLLLKDCIDDYTSTITDCRLSSEGFTYRGRINQTVSGKLCQRWDTTTPHDHRQTDLTTFPDDSISDAGNYCRSAFYMREKTLN